MLPINAQSSQATMFDFTSLWSRNKKEASCEKTSDSNSEKQSATSISTSSHFNTNIDNNIAKNDCVIYIPELDVYRLPEYMKGTGTVIERPMDIIVVHDKDLNQFYIDNAEEILNSQNKKLNTFDNKISNKIFMEYISKNTFSSQTATGIDIFL